MDAEGDSWEDFVNKFRMYALATDLEEENDGEGVKAYDSFTYAP